MVMKLNMILVLVQVFSLICFAASFQNECTPTRCNRGGGPTIRFPFRTRDQPEHCGYPGFDIYCQHNGSMLQFQYEANTSIRGLHLSFSLNASVLSIDYKHQHMKVVVHSTKMQLQLHMNPKSRLPFRPLLVIKNSDEDVPVNPFTLDGVDTIYQQFTFLNCSSKPAQEYSSDLTELTITSANGLIDSKGLYAINSHVKTYRMPLKYCSKMLNVSFVPYYFLDQSSFQRPHKLTWVKPSCGHCEAKGKYCKLSNNSSSAGIKQRDVTTVCFGNGFRGKPILAAKIGGPLFTLLVLVAVYWGIKKYIGNKEDQLKIEKFLADYKALKPTRYSYVDLRKITNEFKEKLGQGGYGSVYKGQLSSDVLVAVKLLNNMDSKGNGEEFINEVSTIGLIHHVNVVRLVGYCADGSTRALVYEFLPNKSLDKYVCSGKYQNNKYFSWEQLRKIALGISKGIEYLHQGCAQRILHFDIKPHNILLDQNFNPKISDFGLAKLCSKGQSVVSMTMARGTIGYIAPEVFSRNFGKVSPKSDVYSFGMLLLEMVGARDNAPVATHETYFPEWIFHRLEQGGETSVQIEPEVDNIARKLTIVGLWCIGWHPVDRPSMKHVIQMLEAEDCPAIPPNPFSSTSSRNATSTKEARQFTNELEVISESE